MNNEIKDLHREPPFSILQGRLVLVSLTGDLAQVVPRPAVYSRAPSGSGDAEQLGKGPERRPGFCGQAALCWPASAQRTSPGACLPTWKMRNNFLYCSFVIHTSLKVSIIKKSRPQPLGTFLKGLQEHSNEVLGSCALSPLLRTPAFGLGQLSHAPLCPHQGSSPIHVSVTKWRASSLLDTERRS